MYIFVTDSVYDEKIKQYLVEKTKLNPTAYNIMKIDEIPKSDSGKTLYKELERYYK